MRQLTLEVVLDSACKVSTFRMLGVRKGEGPLLQVAINSMSNLEKVI